jgi:lipopolysaccharide/colanic/teichoic acid biosynthesis glycosyltransferase
MTDKRDEQGKLLSDELRMTPIGRFVRHTSLDELPQLLNVLKGDMSLVGPRPLIERYIPLYSKEQFRRHEVKPGITGWAQVNGRNNISWAKKFELDVWYVNHLTFVLDIKILWMTLIKVIKRKDITTDDPTAFEPFNGKN